MNCLEAAEKAVDGRRQEDYGNPLKNLSRTAIIWSAILGVEVTAEQVALCMIGVKMSRLCHSYSGDSVVDIAGYARTLQMIAEEDPTHGDTGLKGL